MSAELWTAEVVFAWDPPGDLDRDGDGDLDAVDCAPDDGARGPSAAEWCNARDDDCDGLPDDGLADFDLDGCGDSCDPDRDGDGTTNNLDCAPDDPAVHRLAIELCNGLDDDCDGRVDDGSPDLDWDGLRDDCDPDQDGDGDPDVTERFAGQVGAQRRHRALRRTRRRL